MVNEGYVMMHRKIFLSCLCVSYILLLFGSCTPLGVVQLEVRTTLTVMPADGESKATLQVLALDAAGNELKDWSSQAQLYLNNREYSERTFQTKEPNTYYFVARMGNLQSNVVSVKTLSANDYVYHLMTGSYLWADKITKTNPALFKSPDDIVNQLAYRPEREGMDRWTHISDRVEYDNYYQGKYVGLGIRMTYDKDKQLRMALVYEGTPAHKAGIRRGMIIQSINDKTVKQIEDEELWDTIFGKDEEGVEVTFKLEHNGEVKAYKAAKSSVQLRSAFAAKFLKAGDKQVGYLYFDRFIDPSENELKAEFTRLNEKGVDEFVLDMRYNGGGLLRVASLLGSLIAGEQGKGKIFYKYNHNQSHQHWNTDSKFSAPTNAINVKRVFIIASGGTASASEVVINGLRPLMKVVVVGTKTYGKPVGSYNYVFFNKVLSLVSFRLVNDVGNGDYFQGMEPDIQVNDDVTHDLGDPNEACLKAALQAISSNNLPLLPYIPQPPRKRIPYTGIRQLIQAF